MKILFFGNSHVGAFKQGLNILSEKQQMSDLEKQIYDFYTQNEVSFISIPGPNWKEVTIKDSTIIGIPQKTYKHVNGVRTDEINNSYGFNSFNTLDYDVIVFCKGQNIVDYLNRFNGMTNPPLLTSSLLEILLDEFLEQNKEFEKMLTPNKKTRFVYTGKPVRFIESNQKSKSSNENAMLDTCSRNLSFLRINICNKSSYDLLMPPPHCIDSAGRFTFNRYARDSVNDSVHANGDYGIEILGELKSVLQ